MLDPMTALGIAGNIVQFVDFSIKLLGDAHELHKSAEGSLQESLDVEKVAGTIRILQMKLRIQDDHHVSGDDKAENLLEELCTSCDETAKELFEVLGSLKVQGKKSPWKSMRQAIKSIKGKATIAKICDRLNGFRETLELTILVDLRQKLDLQSVVNSDNFKHLESGSQDIVLSLLQNRSIFTTTIDAQTAELKEILQKEAVIAALQHEDVKSTLLATVEDINELQSREHRVTRQEIAQRAACDAANLKAQMDKRTDEIKNLITATCQAKGTKERVRLTERANAAAASLVAMDLIHGSLMEILAKTNPNHGGHSWKLGSYPIEENTNDYQEKSPRIPQPMTKSPTVTLQEASATPDIASRPSIESSPSIVSLSPSDSRSTVPDTTSDQFEFETKIAEPQYARPPNTFSPYQTPPIFPHSESDYRHPTSPANSMSTAFPFIPPTMHPGMSSTFQYGPQYGPQYPGYAQGYGHYGPYWPPSEPSVLDPTHLDPDVEKKLMVLDDMMRTQKLETDRKMREMEEEEASARRALAERAERAQKELAERQAKDAEAMVRAEAARKAAEERAAWEKRIEDEKKAVLAAHGAAQKANAEEKAGRERVAESEKKPRGIKKWRKGRRE